MLNLVNHLNLKIDKIQIKDSSRLAKLDLTTGLVREFPELQGVIGGFIAEKDKKYKHTKTNENKIKYTILFSAIKFE